VGAGPSHAIFRIVAQCGESCVVLPASSVTGVVAEHMTEFSYFIRSDCDGSHPEMYAIATPSGCVLPRKPLTKGQAVSITQMLIAFAEAS
jgi:hypothetical protein